MWLRVALGIHGTDFDRAIETYNLMSNKYFTRNATNAGRRTTSTVVLLPPRHGGQA
jgi:hypothetical protein